MKKKLLYCVPAQWFDGIFSGEVRARIAELCDVIDAPVPERPDKDFVLRYVGEAEILVTSWGTAEIDGDITSAAPDLKFVAHAGGSVKPIMSEDAWQRGIRATSAAAAIAVGVAEFCLGLMLTVPKRAYWLADLVRRGHWRETLNVFGPAFEIYRQNVGIIGAGLVGRKLIQLLQPFGCNILLYDPYLSEEESSALGATNVKNLEDIFAQCLLVSLHAPLTDETKGMIRGRHFALLPHGAVFINTARAAIVNQKELVTELRRGTFIACVDVTDPEPPSLDAELRRLPNVLLTPHVAGAVNQNLVRIGEFIVKELAAYLESEPLKGEVTRDRLAMIA